MRRLICVFVVRIGHKQVFSWCGSNRDLNYKSDSKSEHISAPTQTQSSRPKQKISVLRVTRQTLFFLALTLKLFLLKTPCSTFLVCFNKPANSFILHIHSILRLTLSQEDADNAQLLTLYRFISTLRLDLHIYRAVLLKDTDWDTVFKKIIKKIKS